jgi:phenylalanyl-tRNA synthetase beta chain
MYGYENIPAQLPAASLIPPKRNREVYWQEMVRNTMKELGCSEAYNYSFIGQKDLAQFAYTLSEQAQLAELENPISEDFAYMRNSLLENLLKNIQKNQKTRLPARQEFEIIRVFELGKVFTNSNKGLQEARMLGAVVSGGSFYAMKGIADFLFDSLGITGAWYDSFHIAARGSRPALWHTGKSAEVKVGSQEIGFVGEISAGITSNLKIEKSVAAFHLNLDKLISIASEEKSYRPLSKFPSVVRDIAILVPAQTKVIDVMNSMNIAGGELVCDIDLFDMFEGGNLPEGRKNLAFHIVYQARDRTLESKEVDTQHTSIIKHIEENPSWEVRK